MLRLLVTSLLAFTFVGCSNELRLSGLSDADSHNPAFVKKMELGSEFRVNRDVSVTESICGENDLQWINDYDGTLGADIGYVRLHKTQVGALTGSNSPSGSKYCTGTMISQDLFITASHCVDSSSVGEYVSFDFERVRGDSALREQTFSQIVELVEEGTMDYAVLRLEGNPGLKFGWAHIQTREPAEGDLLRIVQHPYGEPKRFEAGTYLENSGNYMHYGDLDTAGGSSGSGVLTSEGFLYGVHTNGGCWSGGGSNSGIRLAAAAAQSSVLPGLDARRLPFADGDVVNIHMGVTYLNGNPETGEVSLDAVPLSTGEWQVKSLGDGSFLIVLQTDLDTDFLLTADPESGSLSIASTVSTEDLSVKWRFLTDGTETFLKVVGPNDGNQWLGGEAGDLRLTETGAAWTMTLVE